MTDDMTHPVTRGELAALLAEYPTKQYVDDLGKTFFQALVRLEQRMDAKLDALDAKLDAKLGQLSIEMTRNINAILEAVRVEIRAVTEPYQDHGPRIEKLERAVFPDDGGAVRAKPRVRRRTRPR